MKLQRSTIIARSATPDDIEPTIAVLDDEEVTRWWPQDDFDQIVSTLEGSSSEANGLVIESAGQIAGFVQWYEETDPQYRHAGIDIVLGRGFRNRGIGTTAITLLCDWLFDECGHHRLVIDPNAANERAIATYAKVGFVAVGRMRQYEYDSHRSTWTDGTLMEFLASDRDTGSSEPGQRIVRTVSVTRLRRRHHRRHHRHRWTRRHRPTMAD